MTQWSGVLILGPPPPTPGLSFFQGTHIGLHFHRTSVRASSGRNRMSTALLPVLPWSVLYGGNPRTEADQIPTCPSLFSPSQLHNVMVHLQQENKKLKTEIEEKRLKAGHPKLCTKALISSKTEPTQRGKLCGTVGWRGLTQDINQRPDITKFVGMPHCSGMSTICLLLLPMLLYFSVSWVEKITAQYYFSRGHWIENSNREKLFCLSALDQRELFPCL